MRNNDKKLFYFGDITKKIQSARLCIDGVNTVRVFLKKSCCLVFVRKKQILLGRESVFVFRKSLEAPVSILSLFSKKKAEPCAFFSREPQTETVSLQGLKPERLCGSLPTMTDKSSLESGYERVSEGVIRVVLKEGEKPKPPPTDFYDDDDPDGDEDERIFWGTGSGYLVCVEAKTGRPCADFGEGGMVDVMVGVPRANREERDYLNAMLLGIHSLSVPSSSQRSL